MIGALEVNDLGVCGGSVMMVVVLLLTECCNGPSYMQFWLLMSASDGIIYVNTNKTHNDLKHITLSRM